MIVIVENYLRETVSFIQIQCRLCVLLVFGFLGIMTFLNYSIFNSFVIQRNIWPNTRRSLQGGLSLFFPCGIYGMAVRPDSHCTLISPKKP